MGAKANDVLLAVGPSYSELKLLGFPCSLIAMANLNTVGEKMLATIESIAQTEKVIASEIQRAAQSGDWDGVSTLTTTAKKLTQIKAELSSECSKFVAPASNKFVVDITAGAIAHHYLSATAGIGARFLKIGQAVTLILGKNEVSTVVLKYGRFQDRKNVAKFYASQQIKAGDRLQFTVDSAGKWHVGKI